MTYQTSEDRGAVALTVAICLLVLMGFAALALDGGLGYDDRRGTQNAADNAALAAAWESCNPRTGDPVGAALEVAAENGYDNDDADTTVTVTEVSDGQYEVHIRNVSDATFARPGAGANTVAVSSRAVAECERIPFLGGYAVFANSPVGCSGGFELDLTGASKIITGGVHSNGDLKITGSSTDIDGPITYGGSINPSNFPGSEKEFETRPYPIDIDISEFRPGGARAVAAAAKGEYHHHVGDIDNKWMTNTGYATGSGGSMTIDVSGIYFVQGDIDLKSATVDDGVRVTFVSENGQIKVTGSGNFTAYEPISGGPNDPGLLMFSTYRESPSPTCTGNAIQWSVSNGTWTGVIFAPNGQVRQSSASSATLNGSIFAYTVNLSGSSFNINWIDNPDGTPEFRVELKE